MNFQGTFYPGTPLPPVPEVRLLDARLTELRQWVFPDLRASYWRWYWHNAPGALLRSGGRLYEPGPGELLLITPQTSFATELQAPVGQLYFHFTLPLRLPRTPGILGLPLAGAWRGEIADLAGRLRHGEPASSWEVLGHIYRALAALPPATWAAQPHDAAVERAVDLIRARYPAAPALEELARLAKLSPNSLLRRFRAGTGHSPRQFLQQLRINDACARLQYSEASIDEIAELTGFADRYHFTRVFRRLQGVAPARYRRMLASPARLA
jgi:AraC-like DNA-binding protein